MNFHRCRCGWIKWNRTFQLNWHSKIYIWHRSFRFLSCFSDTPQFAVLFNGQSKIWIFLSLVSLGSSRADIQRATKMDAEKLYFWVKWSIKLQSIKFGWPTLVDLSTYLRFDQIWYASHGLKKRFFPFAFYRLKPLLKTFWWNKESI